MIMTGRIVEPEEGMLRAERGKLTINDTPSLIINDQG
jgi:hypothetical protein